MYEKTILLLLHHHFIYKREYIPSKALGVVGTGNLASIATHAGRGTCPSYTTTGMC